MKNRYNFININPATVSILVMVVAVVVAVAGDGIVAVIAAVMRRIDIQLPCTEPPIPPGIRLDTSFTEPVASLTFARCQSRREGSRVLGNNR